MRCVRLAPVSLIKFLTIDYLKINFLPANFLARHFHGVAICILFVSAHHAAAQDRILSSIESQRRVQLPAGIPRKALPQSDQGPVHPSFQLNYMTLLTTPSATQQNALDQLLAQQQDRRSPLYHHWLTPEQFADRFGLSTGDIAKLAAWLKSQGFTVNTIARSRTWIAFSGSAAQVENAFQTKLHNFSVNGEPHYSNISPAAIPAALSGIVTSVRGLNSFRPRSHVQHRNPEYSLPVTGGDELFIAPGDVTTMYDIQPLYSQGYLGTGERLAVVGRTDVYLADLNAFRAGFNIPPINCTANSQGLITTACNTANFQYVLNGPDPGVNPNSPNDDLPEADLDLEWSSAVAPNAQIIYVNSGGTTRDVFDAYYFAIDNNLAPVITISYGYCELDEALNGETSADETELKQANSQGITFLNSSGDVGAAECDFSPQNSTPPLLPAVFGLAVSYPASSPEATGVGGTMIPIGEYTSTYWGGSNGTDGGSVLSYIPETAWNDISEIGAFCAGNPTNGNCHPKGGVAITGPQTAQEDFWISSTGGGASNCTTADMSTHVCSGGFPKPAYQTVTITGQSAARFSPDVSLMASANFPGYIVCTPQFELVGGTSTVSSCATGIPNAIKSYSSVYGGTSVSTPIFAGIVTLLDQYLNIGNPGLGNINPTLYSLAKNASGVFHPVSAALNAPGSNLVYCQPGDPTIQPTALQCPAGGIMGFLSSNTDATNGYNLVTGLGSVDVANLATAWAAARKATSVTIHAAPTSIVLGQSVTLTANVTPSSASNTVSFYLNGSSTALITATVTSGVATFSTTSLPTGSDTLTASYTGDGYNAPSTTVAPAMVAVIAPDFNLVNKGTTASTVLAGIPATGYSFTVAPTVPAGTFATQVTFSCSAIDPTITCVFSPSSIAAGTAGTQTVSLTITTSGPNQAPTGASRPKRVENRSPWLPFTIPVAGLVLVGLAGRRISKASSIAMFVAVALIGTLIACGGGGGSSPVTIGIAPAAASLWPNNAGWPSSTQAFAASVGNSTNGAVNWTISPSNAGSIDASGNYIAPTVAAGLPSSASVIATSQADSTKTATAIVSLKQATIPGSYNATVTVTEATTNHTVGPYTLTVQ
jgi:subtilase family serine protease